MGYSYTTPLKTPKLRDECAEFLRANIVPFSEPLRECSAYWNLTRMPRPSKGTDLYDPTRNIVAGKNEIAYGGTPTGVGFNTGATGVYHQYIVAVCSWLALQGSKTCSTGPNRPVRHGSANYEVQRLAGHGLVERPVRYYLYDHQKVPVLTEAEISLAPESEREWLRDHYLVDEFGCCPTDRQQARYGWASNIEDKSPEFQKLVRDEQKKLALIHDLITKEMRALAKKWGAR